MKVAVLGAGGTMGLPIARNLLAAGFEITAWNRSLQKAEPLREAGAGMARTPEQAAPGAEILITMLAQADAVLEVMGKAAPAMDDGALWIQMGTIGEEGTERCLELAKQQGIRFLDAPVLGSKQPAEERKLVVLASGDEAQRERAQPLFDAISTRTLWVGEAGASSRLKVAINAWIVAVVEGGAETLALAEAMGLDPRLVLEALSGGPLDLPYLRLKGEAMIEREFEPTFSLALAAKDARLAVSAADSRGLQLPALQAICERFEEATQAHGDKDLSATFLLSAPHA